MGEDGASLFEIDRGHVKEERGLYWAWRHAYLCRRVVNPAANVLVTKAESTIRPLTLTFVGTQWGQLGVQHRAACAEQSPVAVAGSLSKHAVHCSSVKLSFRCSITIPVMLRL